MKHSTQQAQFVANVSDHSAALLCDLLEDARSLANDEQSQRQALLRQRATRLEEQREAQARSKREEGERALREERTRLANKQRAMRGETMPSPVPPPALPQSCAVRASSAFEIDAQLRQAEQMLREQGLRLAQMQNEQPVRPRRSRLQVTLAAVFMATAMLAFVALEQPSEPSPLPNPYAMAESSPSIELSLHTPRSSMQEMPLDVLEFASDSASSELVATDQAPSKPRKRNGKTTAEQKLQQLLSDSAGSSVLEQKGNKEWVR